MAVGQQLLCGVVADKAGGTGDEGFQGVYWLRVIRLSERSGDPGSDQRFGIGLLLSVFPVFRFSVEMGNCYNQNFIIPDLINYTKGNRFKRHLLVLSDICVHASGFVLILFIVARTAFRKSKPRPLSCCS